GLAALKRGEALLGGDPARLIGPYLLQARLAAVHARAPSAAATDWKEMAGIYDQLSLAAPSPVVELSRSIAYSMAYGPGVGLDLLTPLLATPELQAYAPLRAAQGDMLERAGRCEEAAAAFEAALPMASNLAERAFLAGRANRCRKTVSASTPEAR
ncbi:MAG: RNA polymerase subunit sigma-24, partial [Brevundimonas sp.]